MGNPNYSSKQRVRKRPGQRGSAARNDAVEKILVLSESKRLTPVESKALSRSERHRKEVARVLMGLLSGATLLTAVQILIPAPVDQWIMDARIRTVDPYHVIDTLNKTKGSVNGIVTISGAVEYNAATMSIPVTGLPTGNTHYHCETKQFTQYVANIFKTGSFVPEVSCQIGNKIEWISGVK